MNRTSLRPDDERERNLPGMPAAEDRQRPGALEKNRSAWTRGGGGMEGPAGWHSEFGRAGFASTGERLHAPERKNPLDTPGPATPEPAPAATGAQPVSPEAKPKSGPLGRDAT